MSSQHFQCDGKCCDGRCHLCRKAPIPDAGADAVNVRKVLNSAVGLFCGSVRSCGKRPFRTKTSNFRSRMAAYRDTADAYQKSVKVRIEPRAVNLALHPSRAQQADCRYCSDDKTKVSAVQISKQKHSLAGTDLRALIALTTFCCTKLPLR